MTIIKQDPLTVPLSGIVPFTVLRSEVSVARLRDDQCTCVNEEKKRLLRAGVNYQEFKDLVSTVGLRPLNRNKQRTFHGGIVEP